MPCRTRRSADRIGTDPAHESIECKTMKQHHTVIVIGGGTAGLTVAARLKKARQALDVAVVEPSDTHWYQPLWTLVGGGLNSVSDTARPMADVMPKGVTWIKERAGAFQPESNALTLESGRELTYDYLVVAPGIQLNWHLIQGLPETLGRNGVTSNYRVDLAPYTWQVIQGLKNGRALFTQPSTPIKCGGAPQKIMYLTADYLRKHGRLSDVDIQFMSPGTVVFGVSEFQETLFKVIERYGITFNRQHELIAVRGDEQVAVVRVTAADGTTTDREFEFSMLHAVPPQSAPDFVRQSPLANAEGWVDVHKHTLQHTAYANVFSLGDAGSTPNARTGAAVRKQAPIVVGNLLEHMEKGTVGAVGSYNGYSSCPLVTGYNSLVLAEFDYDNRPDPSFPFDTTKERWSMMMMKRFLLPAMYWHGMLKGRA